MHVIFQRTNRLSNYGQKDEIRINYLMPESQKVKISFAQLTTRQINKHLANNFGPIYRIYFCKDYEMHSEYKKFIQNIRYEHIFKLACERIYSKIRFR